MHQATQKEKLRKLLKAINQRQNPQELSIHSQSIMQRIEAHSLFQQAQVVLLFYALHDEPDTHAFINKWCGSKELLLPAVTGPHSMELRRVQPHHPLAKGYFNIDVPTGNAITDYSTINLALIPGVAFDKEGHRLGRGRGYYDQILALPVFRHIHKIGICFSHQLISAVPIEAHDVNMDEIITDTPVSQL